jgi:hypothetical protein
MQWSAVYAILFIVVELPNYDAHVVWRTDPRSCPLTGHELTLDEAVGFKCFRCFKVAPGQGILGQLTAAAIRGGQIVTQDPFRRIHDACSRTRAALSNSIILVRNEPWRSLGLVLAHINRPSCAGCWVVPAVLPPTPCSSCLQWEAACRLVPQRVWAASAGPWMRFPVRCCRGAERVHEVHGVLGPRQWMPAGYR